MQTIPFQLLMIPLYVLLVRDYGMGDSYLGMILPFAISPAAVFIFRQFFLQLPRELFDAARIDGAREWRILRRIAVPLARPAILTATLLTFIGPWNDFLWPFLITKKADMQPLAVSLANYLANVSATVANPFGSVMAGACVLAAPAVGLFIVFQRHFTSSDIGARESRGKPLLPYTLRRLGTVMAPELGSAIEIEGVLNPAIGHTPDGVLHLLPRLVARGNVSRVGLAHVVIENGVPIGVERRDVVLEPETMWERGNSHAGVEDPRITFVPNLGVHVMTYVAFGPLGPRIAVAVSDDLVAWRRLGPVLFGFEPEWDVDLNLYPNKDAVFFPEPVPGPRW